MTDPSTIPDIFAPHCGCHEHVVFAATVRDTDDAICICLEPGLAYGFHFGARNAPSKVSFSVQDTHVRGDFDWQTIDGIEWTSLSMSHDGVRYVVWVSNPRTEDEHPKGRLDICGSKDISLKLEPASIIHDLPFD